MTSDTDFGLIYYCLLVFLVESHVICILSEGIFASWHFFRGAKTFARDCKLIRPLNQTLGGAFIETSLFESEYRIVSNQQRRSKKQKETTGSCT